MTHRRETRLIGKNAHGAIHCKNKGKCQRRESDTLGAAVPPAEPLLPDEYSVFHRSLLGQLSPTTILQEIAAESVICCCWSLREQIYFELNLVRGVSSNKGAEALNDGATHSTEISRWCGYDRRSIREAVKFLSEIKQDVEENGIFRDEWKPRLRKYFGDRFVEALADNTPGNLDAILLAYQLVQHQELYGKKLPKIQQGAPEVIPDPYQQRKMSITLIDQQIENLQHVAYMHAGASRSGLNLHHSANSNSVMSATQDLERALVFLQRLKRNRL